MNDFIRKIIAVCLLLTGGAEMVFGQVYTNGADDPPPIPVVDPIRSSGSGGDNDFVYFPNYDENCMAPVTFVIDLANLVYSSHSDDGELAFFDLPTGYPDMYLEYSLGDGPVDRILLEDAVYIGEENFIPMFRFTATSYPYDFSTVCIEEHTPTINYSTRIVKWIEGPVSGFVNYGACNYTSECDIFSCLTFRGIFSCESNENPLPPDCLSIPSAPYNPNNAVPTTECAEEMFIRENRGLVVSCAACRDDAPTDSGSGGGRDDLSDHANTKDINVSVQPNPFSDHISVNWSEEANIERMSLYDTSGKIISDWTKPNTQSALRINTSNLPKGLYFLKVNTTTSSKVLKLVKQ